MEIINAEKYRDIVITLLKEENLPVDDLPANFSNFLVVTQLQEIIAVVGLEIYGPFALLRSMAVKKQKRNLGIAGKLITAIEDLASSKKIKEIYLLTETAAEYFIKKGFEKITRADVPSEVQLSSEFSQICPQSAVVMKKSLLTIKQKTNRENQK